MSVFVDDIRGQGDALRELIAHRGEIAAALSRLDLRSFDRIVLSGMGGSHAAAYPAWLKLVGDGLPAWWVETSELLPLADRLISPRTLLWLTSQSGESAEVVELLRALPADGRPTVVGLTNTPSSTLGPVAEVVVELHAGAEHAVSTRTFVNTLGAFALAFAAPMVDPVAHSLDGTAAALDLWLESLDSAVGRAGALLAEAQSLIVVGRGASLAAARAGALTIKEAAKIHAEALSGGEFRHGPIELAAANIAIVILAGDERAAVFNRDLAADLFAIGARTLWVGESPPAGIESLPVPADGDDVSRSVAEIVALQVCSLALARRDGIEPGVFRFAAKVTTVQ